MIFTKLKTFIKKPGSFFRYRSFKIRKAYYVVNKFFHYETLNLRKVDQKINSSLFEKGYLKIENQELEKFNIHFKEIQKEIKNKLKNSKKKINYERPVNTILSSKDFSINSKSFLLATNKNLLRIVSNYFGYIPLLTHLSYWFSPNTKKLKGSSQEFHLDHEDIKQLKGFYFLENTKIQNGPTILLLKKKSQDLISKLNYKTNKNQKRLNKTEEKNIKESDRIHLTGKKGTLYLVDTSVCFHKGSEKSEKNRKILAFQYLSPFATSFDLNWKNSDILNKPYWKKDKLKKFQKYLVGLI